MNKGKIISINVSKDKKRIAVSIVAAIFLVILYITIFNFSEQDGEASGNLSHEVTKWIVEGWERITAGNWTEEVKNAWISYWEHPIRKLAHFSEYAVMGILVFGVWHPWIRTGWKRNLLIIAWVFISAALDEWHQTFIADRCGNFMDVLLDTSGGCFGLIVCLVFMKICSLRKGKKCR